MDVCAGRCRRRLVPGRSTRSLGVTRSVDPLKELAPDPPMTPEEATWAASLSPEALATIDAALLSHAQSRDRKVAMIVALAMSDSEVAVPGLPDVFYAQRVRALVASGKLVGVGNLAHMRYSEVRLP